MAQEKDIVEKILESYNDVFADVFNNLVFNGEKVIKEEDLEDAQPFSFYKAEGKIHSQNRDVLKFWKKGKTALKIAKFGIENQSDIKKEMPLRIIGYDGADYRHQVEDTQIKNYYPVITLVLYCGKGKWKSPLSLHDVLNIPKQLKPFVSDYKINVVSISQLTKEQINSFTSDFQLFAQCLISSIKGKYEKCSEKKIDHPVELLNAIEVFTGDKNMNQYYNMDENLEKGGTQSMHAFSEIIENHGILIGEKRGREQGLEQGLVQGALATAKKMLEDKKLSQEDIAKYTGLSLEKIAQLEQELAE